MEIIQQVMKAFGAAVLLPIIIFIFELVLGTKPDRAFRSAIYIGIGLAGLVTILNPFFLGLMGKAVSDMVVTKGIQLPFVDTGWALLAAVAYSTTIGALIIPVGIGVNLIMISLKLTDTLDLDIWNFWHWAFVGSMVYYGTGSYLYGMLAAIAIELFLLLAADVTAPQFQKFFKLPGISFPHASAQGGLITVLILRWVFDKVGLNKINVSSETIRRKFGVFGDSVVIGFLVAVGMGIIAWLDDIGKIATWSRIFALGMGTGAFIYLYPKATTALLEGFAALNDKVRDLLSKHGSKRIISFGMDGALCVGNPDTITVALLTMITTVPLIFLLPGNRFLMLADLGVTPFFLAVAAVAIFNGNIISSYIANVINVSITLYLSSFISPVFASLVKQIGTELPSTGAAMVGADIRPLHGAFYYIGLHPLVLIGAIVIIILLMYAYRKNPQRFHKITGYEVSALKQPSNKSLDA